MSRAEPGDRESEVARAEDGCAEVRPSASVAKRAGSWRWVVAGVVAAAAVLSVWRPWATKSPVPAHPDLAASPVQSTSPMRAQPADDSRAFWTVTRPVDGPVRTDRAVPKPLHTKSRYPAGTRIPVRELPAVQRGIPLPDGSHLPLLNGMTFAPPVQRASNLGPLPKVVALVVDGDGFEWWEHADGSVTTSRYEHVIVGDRDYWDPATPHGAVAPAGRLRPSGR